MALFVKDRAYKYFNHHTLEITNRNVNHQVNVYKLVLKESATNIYGESTGGGKAYYPPVKTHCLIMHEDQMYDYNTQRFGVDITQNVTFYFQREYLKAIDLMLEIGDIIEWNETYWHVDSVVENKLVHSLANYNHGVVCATHMTERSHIQIEETYFGSDDTTDTERIKNI